MKISILIPAYNEEERIKDTIDGLKEVGLWDIIVIDDGSTDKTREICEKCGAKVVSLNENKGKGGALQEGINYVDGDIIAFIDADLGKSSRDAIKLIEPIINNRADVTIARFPQSSKKGGFGLVKGLSRYGVKLLTGNFVYSVLSGQRAFKKEVLKHILPLCQGYGIEVGMTIDILRNGYKIKEVDVNMTHKETARDLKGFMHRGRQFRDILLILLRKAIVK